MTSMMDIESEASTPTTAVPRPQDDNRPLWVPSSKYLYELASTRDPATLSVEEQSKLLLYPPPVIPECVCVYLNVEARNHERQALIRRHRRIIHILQARGADDGAHNVTTPATLRRKRPAALANLRLPPETVNSDASDATAARTPTTKYRPITYARLQTQLQRAWTRTRADDATPATPSSTPPLSPADAIRAVRHHHHRRRPAAIRYHLHRARKSGGDGDGAATPLPDNATNDAVMQELNSLTLTTAQDDVERRIMFTHGPTPDADTAAAGILLRVAARRLSSLQATLRNGRATMRAHDRDVLAWLRTQRTRRFELGDGYLGVRARRRTVALTKESVAESLCAFLLERGVASPTTVVWSIVDQL
jgi:hypothetical protein